MFLRKIGTILARKRVQNFGIYMLGCLGITCFCMVMIGSYYIAPIASSEEIVSITVEPGSSTTSIANLLAKNDLIRSPFVFKLVVRYEGVGKQLRAGNYQLSRDMSLTRIIDELKKGQIEFRTFTVTEGITALKIADLWESTNLGTAKEFIEAMQAPELLEKYVPEGATAEGYLFPNTYKFSKGSTAEIVVTLMLTESHKRWTETMTEDAKSLGLTRHQVITLASIVEREAGSKDEMPLIAGVFHNRLKSNWKLQADPTVLYALGDPDRLLTREDWKYQSPYNTYLHKGLPPGPIGNPGMAAILAALKPEKTSYYYFVAIGKGKHHFSKTLAEHNRMIYEIKRRNAN